MSDRMDFSVPAAVEAEHKLEGAAYKQWRKSMERVAGHQVTFLATLPFFCWLMIYQTGPAGYPLLFPLGVLWVVMFVAALYCVKKQLRHCTHASAAGDGLRIKSWWMQKKIPWGQIKDFYLIDDKEYALQLQDDEQFFLSKDLTNCDTLVRQIEGYVPKSAQKYELSSRTPEELIQGQKVAFLAVWVAIAFTYLRGIIFAKSFMSSESLTCLAVLLAVTTGFVLVYRACLKSFVHQVRIGTDGISLFCDEKEKRYQWSQIRSIQKFLTIATVRHVEGVSFLAYHHFPNPKEIKRVLADHEERLKLTMSK